MAEATIEKLRGLILSSTELKVMTELPDAFIRDYLDIIDNLGILAEEIDKKNDIIKITTLVTFSDSPYSITEDDEEVFFDTDGGPIVAGLPGGIDGKNLRLINTGSSDNDVTFSPAAAEKLFGENTSELIHDQEVIIVTFETDAGWW